MPTACCGSGWTGFAGCLRSPPGLRVTHTPEGNLEFDRVFAPIPAIPQGEVELPAQEASPRNAATMVMSAMVGLASGFVMAAATRQPLLLLVSVIGPLAPFGIFGV